MPTLLAFRLLPPLRNITNVLFQLGIIVVTIMTHKYIPKIRWRNSPKHAPAVCQTRLTYLEKAYFSLFNHTLYVALLRRWSPPTGTTPLTLQISLWPKEVTGIFLPGRKKPENRKYSWGESPRHILPFAHIETFVEIDKITITLYCIYVYALENSPRELFTLFQNLCP